MAFLRTFILAVAIVAVAADTDLEALAKKIIENFRAAMIKGRPDINLPALDPAHFDKIPVTIKMIPFDATCDATALDISGVSGFKITELAQKTGTNTLDMSIELPDIDVKGLYDLVGKVKIGFFKVKLNSNGDLKLALKGIRGSGSVDVTVNADKSVIVNSVKVTSWTYDKIKIDLANLMGGGPTGATVNALINTLVPTFLTANHAKIDQIIETKGLEILNKYLPGIEGQQLAATIKKTHVSEKWVVDAETQKILDMIAYSITHPESNRD